MLSHGYSAVTLTSLIPLNAGHRPNAAIELTHHLQRRSSIRLALGRYLVFTGMWGHVGNMRSCWQHEVMLKTWSHVDNMRSCWQYKVMLTMLDTTSICFTTLSISTNEICTHWLLIVLTVWLRKHHSRSFFSERSLCITILYCFNWSIKYVLN